MDKNLKKYNYKIIKKNILNSAKFTLTLFEYRIILAALSKIKPEDTDFKDIIFTVKDFANIYSDGKKIYGNLYNYINTACSRLASRTIQLEYKKSIVTFQWVSKIVYDKNNSDIHITFHDELKPFILFFLIDGNYTQYMLENVAKMNNIYSVRMYELLKEYKSLNIRYFDIKELRECLGLSNDKYKLYGNFKKKILDVVNKELVKKSDLYFIYDEIKENKKVIGLNFHIYSTNNNLVKSFILVKKDKLIFILNNLLARYLSIRLYSDTLEKIHRLVLIDLIIFMREGRNWGTVLHPVPFIEAKIKEFTEKYDLDNIKDY